MIHRVIPDTTVGKNAGASENRGDIKVITELLNIKY